MRFRKIINLFIHLVLWIIIGYIFNQVFRTEFRTFHIINGKRIENIEIHTFLPLIIIVLLFKALFFYANASAKLIGLLKTRERRKYILVISLIAVILFGTELLVITISGAILHFTVPLFHSFIWLDLLLYIITLGISLTYFLTLEWDKAEQLSRLIAEEQLKTELNFLKAQINPHFFLNTLNNLYSMAQAKDIDELEDGILQLSEMMRYMLYECQADVVAIDKEIKYIGSYIGLTLMRYRQDGNIKVNFNVNGDGLNNFMIAPVILIPFVENAFKHGISLEKKSIIEINILIKDAQLSFMVKNTDNCNLHSNFNNKGIGIANVKRRLEMLYPGKHELHIKNENGFYTVSLKLTGNEMYYN